MTGLIIRPMREADLAQAVLIYRRAFAAFLGIADASTFRRDLSVIETRFAHDPGAALVAEQGGRILGSALGMDWGSQFVVGPLTIDPEHWRGGVGRKLTAAILHVAEARKARLAALFTFPQSATHLRLYESFGFAPMHLTPILGKPVRADAKSAARLFSGLDAAGQASALDRVCEIGDAIFGGLDLRREIRAIAAQSLGETVLIEYGGTLAGFALCHMGAGTEAGDGVLFVKFAAALPGDGAGFERLLDGIEALAHQRGAARIAAGINTGRRDAYGRMLARGFRATLMGVAMHRPDAVGTLRADHYVIDDWR